MAQPLLLLLTIISTLLLSMNGVTGDEAYTLNITATASSQVNVSSGVVETTGLVGNVMHLESSPAAEPTPSPDAESTPSADAAEPTPSADAEPTPSADADKPKKGSTGPATKNGGSSGGFEGRRLLWGYAVAVLLIGLLW